MGIGYFEISVLILIYFKLNSLLILLVVLDTKYMTVVSLSAFSDGKIYRKHVKKKILDGLREQEE